LWADAVSLAGVQSAIKRRILKARDTLARGDKIRLPSERPPAPPLRARAASQEKAAE
jgi:hypothetical protein